jgi:hypothetical protein
MAWSDVFAITGGLSGVPIEEIEQGRLDWEYDFTSADMRPCGRQGCSQMHGHGWIVALRDRRFVHVGNDCARRYANPAMWARQVAAYGERIWRAAQSEALVQARDRAQTFLYWLDNNLQVAAAAALFKSFAIEARGPLLSDLKTRADKGQSEVRREVRLSEHEVSSRREAQTRIRPDGTILVPHIPPTEFRRIGVLRGLGCFKHDVSDLVRGLERDALYLLRNTHGELNKQERALVREAMNDLGRVKRTLERTVSDISAFFAQSNLDLLVATDVARAQGILKISLEPNGIKIARRDHWVRHAA